jgi:hypothetical protein
VPGPSKDASPTATARSFPVGPTRGMLATLARAPRHRQACNRDRLASPRLSLVLAVEEPRPRTRPTPTGDRRSSG